MEEQLKQILASAKQALALATPTDYQALKIKYLGRKSELNLALREIKTLPDDQRAPMGQLGNQIKQEITALIEALGGEPSDQTNQSEFDPTIPGLPPRVGHLHPITQMTNELMQLFTGLGFTVATGPEVELEDYNFDLLNIPDNHPARDAWDTFWIHRTPGGKFNTLLRTHTSPVQIRYMLESQPPIRLIAPGRTFRYEAEDATHSATFYQLEGLMIDRGITLGHLKATIDIMVKAILGEGVSTRLRPSFFPFTEPSFEVDVFFQGKWLELMGCGMVHPQVLKNGGIDPTSYSGFAFGVGLDRLVMLKHGITDIRHFLSGDLDFIEQF
jgi:phenylalanyl-tRNA synthetase alpha chain